MSLSTPYDDYGLLFRCLFGSRSTPKAQEMSDFCAGYSIVPDVGMIGMQTINGTH